MPPLLAFVDIETSGTDPWLHEVIEVGYVLESQNGRESREVEFSLDFDVELAVPEALEVNGWGKRAFAPLATHRNAVKRLLRDLDRAVFIANNPTFDAVFLDVFLRQNSDIDYLRPPWNRRVVDLKTLAAGRLGIAPPLATGVVAEHFNVVQDESTKHRALDDARWNRDLYRALNLWHG